VGGVGKKKKEVVKRCKKTKPPKTNSLRGGVWVKGRGRGRCQKSPKNRKGRGQPHAERTRMERIGKSRDQDQKGRGSNWEERTSKKKEEDWRPGSNKKKNKKETNKGGKKGELAGPRQWCWREGGKGNSRKAKRPKKKTHQKGNEWKGRRKTLRENSTGATG